MSDVLFVCVHNAGRSQMANALFNHLAEKRGIEIRAESAGTQPAEQVHQNAAQVMNELGLDLSNAPPRLISNDIVERGSRVITMGCEVDEDACPALFIKNVEDWGLPDPAGKGIDETRKIRDMVAQRVEILIDSLRSE